MGNSLQKIKTSDGYKRFHTTTQSGDLTYTDEYKMVIFRISPARKITEFIKTGDWKPFSFHSSRINRNILVGMIKGDHAKVTRYSKTGKKIKSKQRDRVNFHIQCYITENINGNICTSDIIKLAVVVVNR